MLLALIVRRNEFIACILEFYVFNWKFKRSIKIKTSTYSNENLIFPIC